MGLYRVDTMKRDAFRKDAKDCFDDCRSLSELSLAYSDLLDSLKRAYMDAVSERCEEMDRKKRESGGSGAAAST